MVDSGNKMIYYLKGIFIITVNFKNAKSASIAMKQGYFINLVFWMLGWVDIFISFSC